MINIKLKGETGRLDKVLTQLIPNKSRTYLQNLINNNKVRVNNQIQKANYQLMGNEVIEIMMEDLPPVNIKAQAMDLDIVFEDEVLLVVNKAKGIVVHPSKGHTDGTLVNGLVYYLGEKLSSNNEAFRPGLVHRIDKDTSGLILIAKNNEVHHELSQQLQNNSMDRHYIALVNGVIEIDSGIIEVPIGRDKNNRTKFAPDPDGKYALTEFNVKERFNNATLIEAKLITGRTHQIRVHLDYIGHPIVGDPLYRKTHPHFNHRLSSLDNGQYLHAFKLSFIHPNHHEKITLETNLPESFENILLSLR